MSNFLPPFDSSIHIKSFQPSSIELDHISQLRERLREEERESLSSSDHNERERWCSDHILHLFLIARGYQIQQAKDMLQIALEWRVLRQPHLIEYQDDFERKMSREAETGKIRRPGYDQWNRPIIVLDNTVENTNNLEDQMLFLAWNLESAMLEMPETVDKFCLFIVRFFSMNCFLFLL
jgi:hypothetical protein